MGGQITVNQYKTLHGEWPEHLERMKLDTKRKIKCHTTPSKDQQRRLGLQKKQGRDMYSPLHIRSRMKTPPFMDSYSRNAKD